MPLNNQLVLDATDAAQRLGAVLARRQTDRIVLAESCTAGLAAALLGQVPGISNWFCGSAVTYRQSTKIEWLGVASQTLESETAESLATTKEMASGVLGSTPEATLAAAITGHLGPDAPPEIDGRVYLAVAARNGDGQQIIATEDVQLRCQTRIERQYESAVQMLQLLFAQLS